MQKVILALILSLIITGANAKIKGSMETSIEGGSQTTLKSSGITTVKGSLVKIN